MKLVHINYNSKTAKTNYTRSDLTFPSQNLAWDNSSRFFLSVVLLLSPTQFLD